MCFLKKSIQNFLLLILFLANCQNHIPLQQEAPLTIQQPTVEVLQRDFPQKVYDGNTEEVLQCLQQGVDVNEGYTMHNNQDSTSISLKPLHIAVAKDHQPIIGILLAYKADINAKDSLGNTPLHVAIEYGNMVTIKMLLRLKADLNIQNNSGDTPLHLAARHSHVDAVAVLLQHGAKTDLANSNGQFPFLANFQDSILPQQQMLPNIQQPTIQELQSDLPQRAYNGDTERALWYLQQGVNVNEEYTMPNNQGGTSISLRALHLAAAQDHQPIIELLLAYKADINPKDSLGDTPLHVAARGGRIAAIKELLHRRADLHMKNSDKDTPLHLAARHGHIDAVTILLQHGAKPGLRNKDGRYALFTHCENHIPFQPAALITIQLPTVKALEQDFLQRAQNNNVEKVYEYLQAGFDVNIQNDDYRTALHLAAARDHQPTIEALIAYKANINDRDSDANTPLHLAAQGGCAAALKALLYHRAKIGKKNGDDDTSLHLAAQQGHADAVAILLQHGAKTNLKNRVGTFPLHLAVRERHIAAVKRLLEHNANVYQRDDAGDTPLHLATQQGHAGLVVTLLKHQEKLKKPLSDEGSESETSFSDGEVQSDDTPLHRAIKYGRTGIVELLLQYEADLTTQESETGYTPLHRAAEKGNAAIVKALLQYRADVRDTDYDSNTPLLVATTYEDGHKPNVEVVRQLLSDGADTHATNSLGHAALHNLAAGDNEELVQLLLQYQANIHAKTGDSFTPLHVAAWKGGSEGVLKTLLQANASIDFGQEAIHGTPLHLAASHGRENIANILLQYGATVDSKDLYEDTPLHLAAISGHLPMVEILLGYGADINAKDTKGDTPLHKAAAKQHTDTVKRLLEHKADINVKNNQGKTYLEVEADKLF